MEKEINFTQNTENIAKFLKERNAIKEELNIEVKTLTEKMEKEAEDNKEKILFSIPFSETLVAFGRQQMTTFFKNIELPEEGLFLRTIKVVHLEYLNNSKYYSNIKIRFELNDTLFNGEISLDCLGFNDEHQRISEQVASLGFDPSFKSAIKYREMKDTLKKIRKIINTEEKKAEK